MEESDRIARYLALNLQELRKAKGWTQQSLAKISQVPRSTITHLESGTGNPSLSNLIKIADALAIGLEELLAQPRSSVRLFKAEEIPWVEKAKGQVIVRKILPERPRGVTIDRMEILPGGYMGGIPHILGCKEYFCPQQGEFEVVVGGERYQVRRGDVLAFPGDQKHAYRNAGSSMAVAISVVVPAGFGS